MCWAGGRIEDHMAHKSPGCSSYYDLSRVARPAVACGQVKRVVAGARRSTSFELEQVRQTAREGLGRRVRGRYELSHGWRDILLVAGVPRDSGLERHICR